MHGGITMNNDLIKIAEQYEKTGQMLLEKAALLRKGIDPNKCIYSTPTKRLIKGCKTCGKTFWTKCAKKKRGYVNPGLCNSRDCEHFTPSDLSTSQLNKEF